MTTFTQDELASVEHALERAARIERAANAVVERWDTPLWKCATATAEYIEDLRNALEGRE